MPTAAPSSLPPVDEVEVVDLAGLRISAGTFVTDARQAPSTRVRGGDAQRIADLWRSLPPDEQMRCHGPPFGLRFYSGGDLLAEGSICWACNNIYGQAGDQDLYHGFDGSHPLSRELLALLERIVGHPAAELR